tara:strand:+ start:574 stop:768 length:195 start_codon:yes stop_codon:yes gene_type:complete
MNDQEFMTLADKFQSPDALLGAYHDGEIDREIVIEALDYSLFDYYEDDITGLISLEVEKCDRYW